jgi:hypothetical protein
MCSLNEKSLKVLQSWRVGVREETIDDERLTLLHIFNGTKSPMYVARMDTHELLYTNKALDELIGSGNAGRKCYEALQEKNYPCDFCTNGQLKEVGDVYIWEFHYARNRWYRCIDQAILWHDGSIVRLEIAFDITDIKEKEKEQDKETAILKEAMSIVAGAY